MVYVVGLGGDARVLCGHALGGGKHGVGEGDQDLEVCGLADSLEIGQHLGSRACPARRPW